MIAPEMCIIIVMNSMQHLCSRAAVYPAAIYDCSTSFDEYIFSVLGSSYAVGHILTGEEALTSVNMSVLIHRNTLVSLLQLVKLILKTMYHLHYFIYSVNIYKLSCMFIW